MVRFLSAVAATAVRKFLMQLGEWRVVSRIFANWNRTVAWLRQIEGFVARRESARPRGDPRILPYFVVACADCDRSDHGSWSSPEVEIPSDSKSHLA
jgi:hypothetical protein